MFHLGNVLFRWARLSGRLRAASGVGDDAGCRDVFHPGNVAEPAVDGTPPDPEGLGDALERPAMLPQLAMPPIAGVSVQMPACEV